MLDDKSPVLAIDSAFLSKLMKVFTVWPTYLATNCYIIECETLKIHRRAILLSRKQIKLMYFLAHLSWLFLIPAVNEAHILDSK